MVVYGFQIALFFVFTCSLQNIVDNNSHISQYGNSLWKYEFPQTVYYKKNVYWPLKFPWPSTSLLMSMTFPSLDISQWEPCILKHLMKMI